MAATWLPRWSASAGLTDIREDSRLVLFVRSATGFAIDGDLPVSGVLDNLR